MTEINGTNLIGPRWFVADLTVDVTHFVEGEIKDWPPHMQDRIYKALATHGTRHHRQYEVVASWCDTDPDSGPFMRVIARARNPLAP